MSYYDRTGRTEGDDSRRRENTSDRWDRDNRARSTSQGNNYEQRSSRGSQEDQDRHDRNVWTRSVDEVRSWFGDDEAERRRIRDEEERLKHDRMAAYHNHAYIEDSERSNRNRNADRDTRSADTRNSGWNGSRGYGSDIDRDYGRNESRSSSATRDTDHSHDSPFRSSNNYGGSRSNDTYRNYPTHNNWRSASNNEDDEMKHGYESQSDHHQADRSHMYGGRDYEHNYPTPSERNSDVRSSEDRYSASRGSNPGASAPRNSTSTGSQDRSGGWQSNDSERGYRSLNNTGRTGIGQDNHLGRERDEHPNQHDKNYSHGDYSPNMNAGGQEYDSRHYEQRGRPGTAINDQAQRGYSQGYGRTGYSIGQASGNYSNPESGKEESIGKKPKNYKGTDDRIYVDVCEALSRELDASDIEVQASGSEITLTGTVRSREEKRRAERVAERVHGVEDIHNQLTVKEMSSMAGEDESTSSSNVDRNSSQSSTKTTSRTASGSNSGGTRAGNGSASHGAGGNASGRG